jgi:hypothetical protein
VKLPAVVRSSSKAGEAAFQSGCGAFKGGHGLLTRSKSCVQKSAENVGENHIKKCMVDYRICLHVNQVAQNQNLARMLNTISKRVGLHNGRRSLVSCLCWNWKLRICFLLE